MKRHLKSGAVLAGDVGGTNTRLGLYRVTGSGVRLLTVKKFPSKSYDSLEDVITDFRRGRQEIAAACFGVAGPVIRGVAVATNLPWKMSEKSLGRFLNTGNISLVNDLVANAYGIESMAGKDFTVLNKGRRTTGNRALLSAGTGLGAAVMFWNGERYIPSPSEGGHVEFGPKNSLELELLRYLFERFGHVSYERVLSGAGLFNIYQFLRESGRFGAEPGWLAERLADDDPAAVITGSARRKKSRICTEALDLFVSIYGAAAGNLALQVMATGGMYIGGGIAPRIIWKLEEGTFMRAFQKKGRLSPIVERIPVRVIMNDRAALLGAAAHAAAMVRERKEE